jgi:group I intron endonuclease
MLEYNSINKINLPVKKTLNSIADTYICINLINRKTYVGSASINCMYRRYSGHLLKGIGGSLLVKRAVKKYGLENFAFIVIETTTEIKNKQEILRIEQKYIDLLLPVYNIAKIARSRLNTKWSLESKARQSIRMKEHLDKIRILKKPVSEETRALLRTIALN